PDRQCAPRELLGLLKSTLRAAEFAEIVERGRQVDTVAAVLPFLKIERFEISRLGKLQPALRLVDLRDVVQRNRHHDICLAPSFPENVQGATENIKRLRLSQLT